MPLLKEDPAKFYQLIDAGSSRQNALRDAGYRFKNKATYAQKAYELLRDREAIEAELEAERQQTDPSAILASLSPELKAAYDQFADNPVSRAEIASALASGPLALTECLEILRQAALQWQPRYLVSRGGCF